MDHLSALTITVSKTSDGKSTYVQIATPGAALPVNIVLIAERVVVEDRR